MKTDLISEILNIIEKEVAPDSQEYIAKQLNELFISHLASLNPERIKEVLEKHFNNVVTSDGQHIDKIIYHSQLANIITDLCSGSQEKEPC